MKRLIPILLVLSIACASLPAKQRAVVSLGASEAALEAAQTAERLLCAPGADQTKGIAHCDGPTAATVGLTDARHLQLAGLFSRAFQAEIAAAMILQTWAPGQPTPASLTDYITIINQILQLVATYGGDVQSHTQTAVTEAAKVSTAVGATK